MGTALDQAHRRPNSGAAALVDKGARWLPDGDVEFAALADPKDTTLQPELL